MIRAKTGALVLAAVCLAAGPLAAAEPLVTLETRWVTVPAGFCDRHLPADPAQALAEKELRAFLTAVEGDRAASVHFSLMSVLSGHEGEVQANDTRLFVTGLTVRAVGGVSVLVPQPQPFEVGPSLTVRPTASADGTAVKLDVKACRSVVEKVDLLPVVSQIPPEAGRANAPPVPFTQYLEAPAVSAKEVTRKLTVSVGGTAVVRGWREPAPEREPPAVVDAVPYLNRLFKNAPPAMNEVVLLVTVKEVRRPEPVAAADSGVIQAAATEVARPTLADTLVAYHRACATGDRETARRLALEALALDPTCFARESAGK